MAASPVNITEEDSKLGQPPTQVVSDRCLVCYVKFVQMMRQISPGTGPPDLTRRLSLVVMSCRGGGGGGGGGW